MFVRSIGRWTMTALVINCIIPKPACSLYDWLYTIRQLIPLLLGAA